METTLYDDNSSLPPDAKKRKVNMTLDLQPANKTKQEKVNDLLATPDVGMFMLTSPDLERFIIQHQQNGVILTTPTPTTQILFPKTVTEEQVFVRIFRFISSENCRKNCNSLSPDIQSCCCVRSFDENYSGTTFESS